MYARQISLLVFVGWCLLGVMSRPDGSETHPLPGPGLSYGGIPYGSMSGNVAEFFKRQATSSGRAAYHAPFSNAADVDFRPIEQWL